MNPFDHKDLPPRDGFDLRAEAHYDEHCGAEPDGHYTPRQVEAYQNSDWGYCGIVVVASRAGVDLGSDAIWGCEYGMLPSSDGQQTYDIDPLAEQGSSWEVYGEDLIDQAIEQAKAKLAEIVDA